MVARLPAVLAIALFLASGVLAQAPYIETFEVQLHNLDVVVTDAAGKPVRGLTKDDFVVTENGVGQEITNFSEYTADGGEAGGTPAVREKEKEKEKGEKGERGAARKFVFFLDELSLHPASRAKLLRNATSLLDTAMREGDQAAVVRPYGAKNILLDYTGDKARVKAAIDAALAESNTRANTQIVGEMHWLQAQLADSSTVVEKNFAVRVYADIAYRRIMQRLGQIRSLVASMSGTGGKKILVLITASLAAQPGREVFNLADVKLSNNPEVDKELPSGIPDYPDLRPEINELGRTAAANGVTIYALQPDIPLELAITGEGGPAPRRQLTSTNPSNSRPMPPTHSLPDNFLGLALDNTLPTIQTLAEQTGGRWYRGDGNVDDAFRQIGDDLRSYYSLAYRASGYADLPHRVDVRVKGRDDLRVRTRSEVMTKSPEREMDDLVVASLVYPRAVDELGMQAVAGTLTKVRGRFKVPVETRIAMDKLTFLQGRDGKYHAVFSVHYGAIGERADFAALHEQRQEVVITADELKALAGKQFRHTSDLMVAQGRVRISVGVLDLISKKASVANLDIKAK